MAGYPYGGGQPYGYGGSPPPQPYAYGGSPPSAPYASAGSDKPSKADKPSKDDKLHGGVSTGGYPSAPPPQSGYAGGYGSGGYAQAPPHAGGYGSGGYAPAPPHTCEYGSGGYAPAPPQSGGYGSGGYAPAPPQAGGYGSGGYGPAPPQAGGYGGGYPPTAGYGSPFAALIPSAFPPGTDPNVVACFQAADADGSGFIDDKELQRALSSYNQSFSLRTVHLLMYLFTSSNVRKIGPKEFISVFYSLQDWRAIFDRADRDRSGKIDPTELRDALLSLGFSVSPTVLDVLVSKFDKTGGKSKAIEYDNFIECCLTVKGLTEKFKEKDTGYSGSATFTYESFMLTVVPFLIA